MTEASPEAGAEGPVCLLVHGTEEQEKRFLPGIAKAEVDWAKGFSEPASRSRRSAATTRRSPAPAVWNGVSPSQVKGTVEAGQAVA